MGLRRDTMENVVRRRVEAGIRAAIGPITAPALGRALRIPKGTVYRHLRDLIVEGRVERSEKQGPRRDGVGRSGDGLRVVGSPASPPPQPTDDVLCGSCAALRADEAEAVKRLVSRAGQITIGSAQAR
jgi:predicted ArsR family transcriptional regulator